MDESASESAREEVQPRIGTAERDVIALGIATAAIILFVGKGGPVLAQLLRSLGGYGIAPDKVMINALLLNIALIIFGWRRYRQLAAEVRERRKAEEHARVLAETDPLTGCLNRRSINEATNALIARSAGRGDLVAFMMIDLDNFKQINDLNGHSTGDVVLQRCAQRISALLPENSLLARIGGDEFAVICEGADQRSAALVASRVQQALKEPVVVDAEPFSVSMSIGLALSPPHSTEDLLRLADIAMYQAKAAGKGSVVIYDPACR